MKNPNPKILNIYENFVQNTEVLVGVQYFNKYFMKEQYSVNSIMEYSITE